MSLSKKNLDKLNKCKEKINNMFKLNMNLFNPLYHELIKKKFR